MNIGRTVAAAALLVLSTGCQQRVETGQGSSAGHGVAEVDAIFASWDRPGSPGCALAVARHGDRVYSRGYGFANLDDGVPVTPQTVFDVGSITKQFIAASVSMLELEGRLSVDDDVRRWLPELPAYEQPVTPRHMLYHTSGLRDYLTLFPLAGRGHYYPISRDQILDMMSRQRALIFLPGERYLYSNTAYMLLAEIVERVAGEPLGEFTESRIFGPLGMTGTVMYDDFGKVIPRRAIGYDRHEDGTVRMVHNFNFDVVGDGQLYTTVEDLLRWDDYLHGDPAPAIHAAMLTEGTLNDGSPIGRGRGLFLGEYRGQRTVYHTGSSWGFRAALVRLVDPGLTVAVACNDGFAPALELAYGVADHYLVDTLSPKTMADGDGALTVTDATTSPPAHVRDRLDEYVGDFFSAELDATYRIALHGENLVVRIEQEPPLTLVPVAPDEFRFSFDEQAYSGVLSAMLSFERSVAGPVTGFRLSAETEVGIIFVKRM